MPGASPSSGHPHGSLPPAMKPSQPAPVARRMPATAVPPGQAVPSAPASSSSEVPQAEADSWTEKQCEVHEYQSLVLGPFEPGVICDIVHAWYGVRDDPGRRIDVTQTIREYWDPQHGLRLSGFNGIFGDPARLCIKTLSVTYRLSNVRSWDVSRGNYTEGVGAVSMMPIIVTKAAFNLVGATVAAGGYAVGKAMTAWKNRIDSDQDASVADSQAFQAGFKSWLHMNGIFPSVSYEPVPGNVPAEDMRQTPLIVSNHMCYLDGAILAAIFGAPKIIAMQGTLKAPLIGFFAEEIGVIEVNRSDKNSRSATLEAIRDHSATWEPGKRPMLLFPEGTTSNGDSVLEFKKGAFVPGKPVRPVVLTYTGDWHPANTNFKTTRTGELEPTGDLEWCKQFLGHAFHSLQVRVLKPYIPNSAERKDPELYARNIHALMAEEYNQLLVEVDQRRRDAEHNPLRLVTNAASNAASSVTSRLWNVAEAVTAPIQPMQSSARFRAHSMPSSPEAPKRVRPPRHSAVA